MTTRPAIGTKARGTIGSRASSYDQAAGLSLNTWLSENPASNPASVPDAGLSPVVYTEEAAWVRSLCQYLGVPDDQRTAFNGWGAVLPGHMKTNFQFEKLALIWNDLDTPDKMPRCEILPPN